MSSEESNSVNNEKIVEGTESGSFMAKHSVTIIAFIVGIMSSVIVAYLVIPNDVDKIFASVGDSLSSANESAATNYSQPSNDWGNNQEPPWVAQQRADMEKRHQGFEQRNADAMAQNRSSSQQPQWAKDQQAQMQQQQAKYQEWARQNAERARNQQPVYTPNPQQYNNAYPQPNNYNNAPRYYGPNNAPYGYGYPTR